MIGVSNAFCRTRRVLMESASTPRLTPPVVLADAMPLGPRAGAPECASRLVHGLVQPAQSRAHPFIRPAWPAHPAPSADEAAEEIHGVILDSRQLLGFAIAELRFIATTGKPVWDEDAHASEDVTPRRPEVFRRLNEIADELERSVASDPSPVGEFSSQAAGHAKALEGAFWSIMHEAARLDPSLSPDSGLIRIVTLDSLRAFPEELRSLRDAIEHFQNVYNPEV